MSKFGQIDGGPRSLSRGQRYVATEEQSGTWQIVDTATGLPTATNGREFVQLTARDAKEIAAELNACEAQGGKSPLLWRCDRNVDLFSGGVLNEAVMSLPLAASSKTDAPGDGVAGGALCSF
jgi:hypothetical protein